jgi:hypothetical protein
MLGNVLVDLRNMFPEALAEEAGFIHYGIGRTLPPPVSRTHTKRRDSVAKGRDMPQPTH